MTQYDSCCRIGIYRAQFLLEMAQSPNLTGPVTGQSLSQILIHPSVFVCITWVVVLQIPIAVQVFIHLSKDYQSQIYWYSLITCLIPILCVLSRSTVTFFFFQVLLVIIKDIPVLYSALVANMHLKLRNIVRYLEHQLLLLLLFYPRIHYHHILCW
jgi:hypothetical protein